LVNDRGPADDALLLIDEGAHPAIAASYMQLQTGDLEVDINQPIPVWQIMALLNNEDTLLEVSAVMYRFAHCGGRQLVRMPADDTIRPQNRLAGHRPRPYLGTRGDQRAWPMR